MIGADPDSWEDLFWGLMLAASDAVGHWYDFED